MSIKGCKAWTSWPSVDMGRGGWESAIVRGNSALAGAAGTMSGGTSIFIPSSIFEGCDVCDACRRDLYDWEIIKEQLGDREDRVGYSVLCTSSKLKAGLEQAGWHT